MNIVLYRGSGHRTIPRFRGLNGQERKMKAIEILKKQFEVHDVTEGVYLLDVYMGHTLGFWILLTLGEGEYMLRSDDLPGWEMAVCSVTNHPKRVEIMEFVQKFMKRNPFACISARKVPASEDFREVEEQPTWGRQRYGVVSETCGFQIKRIRLDCFPL